MNKNKQSVKKLKTFLSNQDGVAAIEFVLTFPILIAILFGCVELYGHFNASRKLGNVTASFADIVAQSQRITKDQLAALNPLSDALLVPLDANEISYTISSVRQGDAGDDPVLVWEYTQAKGGGNGSVQYSSAVNCPKFTGGGSKDFPPNQDVIYISSQFTYESTFSEIIGGPVTYSDEMISVPRSSSTVRLFNNSGTFLADCN